jgi:streptogramin lyase
VTILSQSARAQPQDLLVNYRSLLFSLDRYDEHNGTFLGPFANPGISGVGTAGFAYGPDGNVYIPDQFAAGITRCDGVTGTAVGSPIAAPAGFRFGSLAIDPAGIMYVTLRRQTTGAIEIDRYDARTGMSLGTWVPASSAGLTTSFLKLALGPTGDLFVTNGNTIERSVEATGRQWVILLCRAVAVC